MSIDNISSHECGRHSGSLILFHEGPVMRVVASLGFCKGMVAAVAPGLHHRGLGGARIKDVVHVVTGGCEKSSSAPYQWEIA